MGNKERHGRIKRDKAGKDERRQEREKLMKDVLKCRRGSESK